MSEYETMALTDCGFILKVMAWKPGVVHGIVYRQELQVIHYL